ncbi:MAG TPA: hypothetical protein VNF75_04495 [Candidatus Dormibacteraeota bacterium]|nr:hypothetical protein [Candidatus Dormibacteraeota bacterium]
MIAAAVLGVVVAAVVVAIGLRLPPPSLVVNRLGRNHADGWTVAALGVPVAVTLLVGALVGASAPHAGSMLVPVVAALILFVGSASGWAWLRLRRSI